MPLHRISDFCPNMRGERAQLSHGAWSKNDIMPHSDQKIARTDGREKNFLLRYDGSLAKELRTWLSGHRVIG